MAGFLDTIAADPKAKSRVVKIPQGFDDISSFLADMREKYEWGYSYNEHNITAGKDDAKFVVGKQWDEQVKLKRENANKPALTFNRLVAFLAQVIGDRLMNETEIRVLPEQGTQKAMADIREGLIRSIFKNSDAEFARGEAYKYQVIGGQGAYYLSVDYTSDDVFEQEIRVCVVYDPYAVIFDPLSVEPSAKDANFAFIGEDIPQQEFKKRYPWASETSFMDEKRWNKSGFWMSQDTVRIVSYWRMVTDGYKTLALYTDGTVHDVTDMEDYEYAPFVEHYPDGTDYIRTVPKRFARLYICSGNDILEGPYDYSVSSLPVYRVPGWEVNDGEHMHRWGLIRFLKDPQRLHNYWRSTIAEQLVAAPRNKWLVTPDAVKGHERKWRNAATSDDPFLYYNDGETPPTHIPPPGVDAALINEASSSNQDLKDISNLHEAALGMPSNEVSGVALQSRQSISDVGTYIYKDRARIADERCAVNINELISVIYDTKRTAAIIGPDNKTDMIVLNDPSNPMSDMTVGKFKLAVAIGAASATKRMLANEQMTAFVNAAPQIAPMVMDLIAEAQDWPQSVEFARRFKMGLPPGMIPPDEMTPEMQAMQEKNQQQQEQAQQIQMLELQLKMAQIQAKTGEANSRAHLSVAQAYKAVLDAHSRATDVAGKQQERGVRAALDITDQHNNMIGDDRDHVLNTLAYLTDAYTAQQTADIAQQQVDQAGQQTDNSNGEQ
jgi:hypothetical protein